MIKALWKLSICSDNLIIMDNGECSKRLQPFIKIWLVETRYIVSPYETGYILSLLEINSVGDWCYEMQAWQSIISQCGATNYCGIICVPINIGIFVELSMIANKKGLSSFTIIGGRLTDVVLTIPTIVTAAACVPFSSTDIKVL